MRGSRQLEVGSKKEMDDKLSMDELLLLHVTEQSMMSNPAECTVLLVRIGEDREVRCGHSPGGGQVVRVCLCRCWPVLAGGLRECGAVGAGWLALAKQLLLRSTLLGPYDTGLQSPFSELPKPSANGALV
jgi:hypothetical protein